MPFDSTPETELKMPADVAAEIPVGTVREPEMAAVIDGLRALITPTIAAPTSALGAAA